MDDAAHRAARPATSPADAASNLAADLGPHPLEPSEQRHADALRSALGGCHPSPGLLTAVQRRADRRHRRRVAGGVTGGALALAGAVALMPLGLPLGEQDYIGRGGPASGEYVMIDTLRWSSRDGAELDAARQWGGALAEDAARCAGAVVLGPSGVPGERPLMTATPRRRGTWHVQVATTGGPTGLRAWTTVPAASAEEAGAVVAGLVTTAVGRLVSADDLAVTSATTPPTDRP